MEVQNHIKEIEKTASEATEAKHIMTFVMGRERIKSFSGSYNTWCNRGEITNHDPDKVDKNGLRDISSVLYPAIGLYDVTDPDYQEYMMQLCKMCYIDTINYYVGTTDDIAHDKTPWGRGFDDVTVGMLRRYGLSSSIRLEKPERYRAADGDDAPVLAALTATLDKLDDTVLTIDGRPVMAQFATAGLTPESVERWKKEYAATHNGVEPFFMSRQEGVCTEDDWFAACDGQFSWVELDDKDGFITFDTQIGIYRKYVTFSDALSNHRKTVERAREYLAREQVSFYAESVTPGFDDKGCWGWGTGPRKIESGDNCALYEYKWRSAVANAFSMVTIPTWDDWGEATLIEPTLQQGIDYLEITRRYAAEFKGLTPNTASLELPGWIYKIRKTAKDKEILEAMDRACELMVRECYNEAEALVKPYVGITGIPATSKELFNYPTTPTKPMPEKIPFDHKAPVMEEGRETHFPTDDTYVVFSRQGGKDAGCEERLKVKRADATFLSRCAYLRFDTADTKLSDICRATLKLYCTFANTDPVERQGRAIKLYATDAVWREFGLSWNAQPEKICLVADVDNAALGGGVWVEIDVTQYVRENLGKAISFALINEGADTENNHVEFTSREAEDQEPRLIIH